MACVFLLVLLGTAISRSSNDSDPIDTTLSKVKSADPEEPLAQIGAAPGTGTANSMEPEAPKGASPKP